MNRPVSTDEHALAAQECKSRTVDVNPVMECGGKTESENYHPLLTENASQYSADLHDPNLDQRAMLLRRWQIARCTLAAQRCLRIAGRSDAICFRNDEVRH